MSGLPIPPCRSRAIQSFRVPPGCYAWLSCQPLFSLAADHWSTHLSVAPWPGILPVGVTVPCRAPTTEHPFGREASRLLLLQLHRVGSNKAAEGFCCAFC